jgi:DNA-binding CsgD family transcriptional regulator
MSGLDRSAAFTVLLELDPEGFGKQDMDESGRTITRFLADFAKSGSVNMFDYGKQFVSERREREIEARTDMARWHGKQIREARGQMTVHATLRRQDVLRLVYLGVTQRQIAESLGLTQPWVKMIIEEGKRERGA